MNKTIRALALVIFALAFCKGGLSAQITNLLIGSEERVIENGLRNADHIQVFIQQLRPDGLYRPVSQDAVGGFKFTSKSHLDSQVALILRRVAQGAVDNDAGQNKDGEFLVSVIAAKRYADIMTTIPYLGGYLGSFRLVRNGGMYSLPDLSGFVVGVPNMNVLYHVQGLAWARITITDENGTRTIDSAEEPDPMVDLKRSCLVFPKELALSGTNGPYQIKISLISGLDKKFQKFDGSGNLVAEDPPTINLTLVSVLATGTTEPQDVDAMITVRRGDIGRSFKLQSSTNFSIWTDVPDTQFSVRYTFPYLDHRTYVVPGGNENKFYRLSAVNKIPVYEK